MLLTECPQTDLNSNSALKCDVQIRFLGGARNQSIIPLALGNHSVGSGPKCSVRLRDSGVGPMHCLIVRDEEGIRVRRWSSETLLNGQPFNEAPLVNGDHLSVGPIDLEMMAPVHGQYVQPLAEPMPDISDCELGVIEEVQSSLNAWPNAAGNASGDVEVEDWAERAGGVETPGMGLEILSALEGQRAQFDELLSRVDELEQKVESALAEGDEASSKLLLESSPTTMAPAAEVEQDWWLHSEPSLERDRREKAGEESVWSQVQADAVAENANLKADLSLAHQQIADALTELGEAQATIDDLQTRLADSLRAWQELSDERAAWQLQLDELENQLAVHATRAKELQDRLQRSQLSAAEATVAATTPTNRYELQDEPAEVATSDFDWTAPVDTTHPPAVRDDSYDWSIKSPEANIEFGGSTSAEDATDASDLWPSPTPWTSRDSTDVTADDSVDSSDELIQSAEPRPAARRIETEPPVETRIAAATITPKRESESRLSGDISEAMAHLRELSLWRRVPESSTEAEVNESVADPIHLDATEYDGPVFPAVEEQLPPAIEANVQDEASSSPVEAVPAAKTVEDRSTPAAEPQATAGTTSFIERYAHMFENEDRKEEAPASTPALDLKDVMGLGPRRDNPAGASAVTTDATQVAGDTDESIEKYMARMMQRIRGDVPSGRSSMAPTAPAIASTAGQHPRTDTVSATPNVAADKTVAANTTTNSGDTKSLIRLQDLKRKEPTPEFSTDMGALRALANQTARHAIGVHTTRTLRRNSVTRFIVSLLAGTTTVYFLLNAPDWQSNEFATACVSLVAALYWGRMTFVSLIKAVRMGAFDDLGSEFAPVESSNPPLPIDVRR